MKFLAKEIGINKPIFINTSNKNIAAVYDFQLKLAESEEVEAQFVAKEIEPLEYMRKAKELAELPCEFISSLIDLKEYQKEKLDNLDYHRTLDLANRLCMRMLGFSEQSIKDSDKKERKKSVQPKKSMN